MRTPLLLINFKNYPETAGSRGIRLARIAEGVARELGVEIAIAPPIPLLASAAQIVAIPVFAQHVDPDEAGNTTGAIVAEQVKEAGGVGSLVNHSERRIPFESIQTVVQRLAKVNMASMVCARSPEEVTTIASLSPSFVAIEPPELIGSGRAVSKVQPDVVRESAAAAYRVNPHLALICGAGIVSGEDVEAALRLGAKGALVASGIVKAKDWGRAIREIARPLSVDL